MIVLPIIPTSACGLIGITLRYSPFCGDKQVAIEVEICLAVPFRVDFNLQTEPRLLDVLLNLRIERVAQSSWVSTHKLVHLMGKAAHAVGSSHRELTGLLVEGLQFRIGSHLLLTRSEQESCRQYKEKGG